MNTNERRENAMKHIAFTRNAYYTETSESTNQTIRYYPDDYIPSQSYRTYSECRVEVVGTDSVSAIFDMLDRKACILDFASYINPGGEYINGAIAQEEALCSESNLYDILLSFTDTFYNQHANDTGDDGMSWLYTDDSLFVPNVMFSRGEKTKNADVIVCAAPNTRIASRSAFHAVSENECYNAMFSRLDRVLAIASDNGCRNLILGAFGCGVFGNDAATVAKLWKRLLDSKYAGVFDHVVFAVLPGNDGNLDAFQRVF